jgi:hypothetical protein
VFLAAAGWLTAACCCALAYAPLLALRPLALAAGLLFGAHWSLMPSLASEIFGLAHFASNYTLLQLAPAAGSLGLAARLAGHLYQHELARQGQAAGGTCVGAGCFRPTFLVLAALAMAAAAASSVLCRRTRGLYRPPAATRRPGPGQCGDTA